MLFIISQSPFAANALQSCLQHAPAGSALLLIENGVYAALANSQIAGQPIPFQQLYKVYALQEDLAARGLLLQVLSEIAVIDYDGFVELTLQHEQIINWS